MTKSKRPIAKPRKRRPKSVLKKAWQTRRFKAEAKQMLIDAKAKAMVPGLNQLLYGDNATGGNQASPKPRSEVDAIGRTIEMHRDEQLCAFVADLQAICHRGGIPSYAPILVSRPQVEAIEEFLRDHGYSPFGKGSGSLASVSTNPNAKAA